MTTKETTRQAREAEISAGRVCKQYDVEVDASTDDRKVDFIVTTSTPDRERDVLDTRGIDTSAYERNPVVQWAHDYKSLPVGRAVAIRRTPNQMIATVEFATADMNPFAEYVYRMVKAGFLRACSIGFRPLEWDYDETRRGVNFKKSEMLEFSVCPIPANSEALVAASAAGIDQTVLKDWATRTLAALNVNDEVILQLADDTASPASSNAIPGWLISGRKTLSNGMVDVVDERFTPVFHAIDDLNVVIKALSNDGLGPSRSYRRPHVVEHPDEVVLEVTADSDDEPVLMLRADEPGERIAAADVAAIPSLIASAVRDVVAAEVSTALAEARGRIPD